MRPRFKSTKQLVSLGFSPTQSNFKNKQSPDDVAEVLQVTNRIHMTGKSVYGEIKINGKAVGIVTAKGLIL